MPANASGNPSPSTSPIGRSDPPRCDRAGIRLNVTPCTRSIEEPKPEGCPGQTIAAPRPWSGSPPPAGITVGMPTSTSSHPSASRSPTNATEVPNAVFSPTLMGSSGTGGERSGASARAPAGVPRNTTTSPRTPPALGAPAIASPHPSP